MAVYDNHSGEPRVKPIRYNIAHPEISVYLPLSEHAIPLHKHSFRSPLSFHPLWSGLYEPVLFKSVTTTIATAAVLFDTQQRILFPLRYDVSSVFSNQRASLPVNNPAHIRTIWVRSFGRLEAGDHTWLALEHIGPECEEALYIPLSFSCDHNRCQMVPRLVTGYEKMIDSLLP